MAGQKKEWTVDAVLAEQAAIDQDYFGARNKSGYVSHRAARSAAQKAAWARGQRWFAGESTTKQGAYINRIRGMAAQARAQQEKQGAPPSPSRSKRDQQQSR